MVPPGVSYEAVVRCPLCAEEFTLGDALKRLPPLLIVVDDPNPPAASAGSSYKPKYSGASSPSGLAVDTGIAPAVQMKKEGAAPRRAPRPSSKRPPKKQKSVIFEMVKIVGGGVIGITLAILLLWYLPGGWHKDPFGLAPKVYEYAPWMVPLAVLPEGHRAHTGAPAVDAGASDGGAADGQAQPSGQQPGVRPEPTQFAVDGSEFGPPGGAADGSSFGPPGGVADASDLTGDGGGSTPVKPKNPKQPKPVKKGGEEAPREDPVTPIGGSPADGGDDDGLVSPFIDPPAIDLPSIDAPVIGEPEFKPPEDPGAAFQPAGEPDAEPLAPVVEFGKHWKPKKAVPAAAVTVGVAAADAKYKALLAAASNDSLKPAERITAAFEAYVAASELAATSAGAAANDNGPTRKELIKASKLLSQIASNDTILPVLAKVCDKWCDDTFEWPGAAGLTRPTDGVLVAGEFISAEPAGGLSLVKVKLTSGATLALHAAGDVEASPGDMFVAYAVKVASPASSLNGYDGDAKEVTYATRFVTPAAK